MWLVGRGARGVWRLKSREFGRIAFKRLKVFNAFKEPCAKPILVPIAAQLFYGENRGGERVRGEHLPELATQDASGRHIAFNDAHTRLRPRDEQGEGAR
jgi:hypothetical protein